MKLRPNSVQQNREVSGNISQNLDYILGSKNSFTIVYFLVSSLVGICSIGSKLIIRKHLGVRTISIFHLVLHLAIIYAYLTDLLYSSPITVRAFIETHPIVSWYMIVLIILSFLHYFNCLVLKENQHKHTLDRGYGPFNYIFRSFDDKRGLYLRLIDPCLIALISLAFLTDKKIEPLVQIIIVSSAFLLLEELLIVYRSWQALLDLRDVEKEAQWLAESHEAFQKNMNAPSENSKQTVFRVRSKKK